MGVFLSNGGVPTDSPFSLKMVQDGSSSEAQYPETHQFLHRMGKIYNCEPRAGKTVIHEIA